MKNYEAHIESLFEKAEDCTKTTLALLKLKAIDSSAEFVSFLVVKFVLFSFICLFIIIANIGVALWIGDLLGKYYYVFFISCFLWFDFSFSSFLLVSMDKSANQ